MKIAVLGYGLEGHSVENYFKPRGAEVTIFDRFEPAEIPTFHLENFNLVFRSPSIPPLSIKIDSALESSDTHVTSNTIYFFEHCPAPIIGVTGTKGKGTTCSIIKNILKAAGHKVWFVGNIGHSALDVLDQIEPTDTVIYEMSSFQLWDLQKSPHVAVVLRIEAEHLDIHKDFADYFNAKSNIAKHQTPDNFCIYYQGSADAQKIAAKSPGKISSYPIANRKLVEPILDALTIPGQHNRENAEAAIVAVAAAFNLPVDTFINDYRAVLQQALSSFQALPHHIEFLRELGGVKYYDDNYSTSYPSLDVALKSFSQPIVLIAGGYDRGLDLTESKRCIFDNTYLHQAILIGQTKQKLAEGEDPSKYQFADTLEEAVEKARSAAEAIADKHPVLLMSPGAASFDMFKNYLDRGEKFQAIVKDL